MGGAHVIGIDVGTTSVKAALIDGEGRALKSFASAYPTRRPAASEVEQDAADWTRRVEAALAELVAAAPTGAIAAIGLTSQVNTHVFVGADGAPLMPAVVWQDGRAARQAAALDARVAHEDRLRWWGAPLPIDASHPLARMAWLAETRPDLWAKTRRVLAPKDFCQLALTGETASDPLSNFGLVDSALGYIEPLIALVPGAAERLPALTSPTACVGRVRAGLPGAGLPVVATTMDAWAGMIGAGAVANGDAAYLSGTSEVGGIVSSRRIPTPGVVAFPACLGLTLHAGPTQAGGASVAWLAALLGRAPDQISALAAACDPDRPGPTFLPHLQGERAPLWDIAARASFSGLDGSMGAPELALATLEGVAYSVRLLMGALEKSSGVTPERLRHAGGGARSDLWCQIRADALGKPIERKLGLDSGVVGAAMLAGVGVGLYPSLAEAARRLAPTDRVFAPDPARRARHDDGFARYCDLYARLKGFGAA